MRRVSCQHLRIEKLVFNLNAPASVTWPFRRNEECMHLLSAVVFVLRKVEILHCQCFSSLASPFRVGRI